MSGNRIAAALSAIEGFFDRLKLGYKWRFDRWKDLRVVAYRGYGTARRVHLQGRVLDDPEVGIPPEGSGWITNVRHTIQRVETDEVPGAEVELSLGSQEHRAVTDGDGFFRWQVDDPELSGNGAWHAARAELIRPAGHPAGADIEFVVPTSKAELVVVTDLDDTIIRSGARSRLRMARTVLLNNPRSRVPFPGVADFYRALSLGPEGEGENPIFYVSSSPWNLYSLFHDFLECHDIPRGPILLRDFGFGEQKLWKKPHEDHKLGHLRDLLETYPRLPFVLVGDSGQEDPEIFAKIVEEHGDRVAAVFLRDVTPPDRDREVRELGEAAEERGVPWVLTEDTAEAARRALELGLVTEEAAGRVKDSAAR